MLSAIPSAKSLHVGAMPKSTLSISVSGLKTRTIPAITSST